MWTDEGEVKLVNLLQIKLMVAAIPRAVDCKDDVLVGFLSGLLCEIVNYLLMMELSSVRSVSFEVMLEAADTETIIELEGCFDSWSRIRAITSELLLSCTSSSTPPKNSTQGRMLEWC